VRLLDPPVAANESGLAVGSKLFPCLVRKRFPLAIPLYSPLLIHIRARSPVTSSLGIQSVSRSPRSLILEQLIPPLAKPFFDSPGNRSVKVVDPALFLILSGNAVRSAIVPFYSLAGIDAQCVKRLGGPPKPNKAPKVDNATFTVEHVPLWDRTTTNAQWADSHGSAKTSDW
jgi:hypothetical protein